MQVLIRIPDEEYKKISNSNPSYADDFLIYYAIKNGTPLDSIKADVINIADGRQSIKVRSVLRILDRIGKAEREDKECEKNT